MCVGRFGVTCVIRQLAMLRPTIRGIVIIVIIIVSEAQSVFHNGGIIAQDYLSSTNSAIVKSVDSWTSILSLGCKACVRCFICKPLPIRLKMLYIYFVVQSIDSKGE